MPFPFDIWPWARNSDLNVAYWIKKLEEISAQAIADLTTLEEWKAATEEDLALWKAQTLESLNAWETALTSELELWKTQTGADITEWERGVLSDLSDWKAEFLADYETLEARVEAIVSSTEDMIENLAPPFSASADYLAGDYVVQNGMLYRFSVDHPAGAWIGTDAARRTAMQGIDDLASDEYFNELYANAGVINITAAMLETGIWYRGNKQANPNRGRLKRIIPVKAGMALHFDVSAFDAFWAIAAGRTWTSYAQGGTNGTWVTATGSTSVSITTDGYLVFMIRNHGADTTPVDVSAFDQAAYVETYIERTFARDDLAFLPRGVLPNGSDLNTLRNPGTYIMQSGYTYANSPITSSLGGLLMIFKGSNNTSTEVIRTISSPAYTGEYQRSLTLATTNPRFTPWIRINGSFTLFSTFDDTDRTAELTAALDALHTVRLGRGEFYLDNITLTEGCELSGCGPATEVYSIASNYGSLFDLADKCSIHDMTIIGDEDNARSGNPNQRDAVHFVGSYIYDQGGSGYERGMIYNLRIRNFSGSGIKLSHTGPNIEDHCLLHNIQIEGCGIGINIDYSSEYHRITSCSVQRCWWGMINNGGNNIVTACDFSGNIVGLLMSDNPAGSAINNSHGTFEGCTFNHSRSAAGTPNKGTAIQLYGLDYGEIFTGCQVFFGAISVQNCIGVRFIGLNVGGEVPITLTGNTVISFTDCTFKDAPSSADSPVSGSGNHTGTGGVLWTNCFLRDGTVFAPAV